MERITVRRSLPIAALFAILCATALVAYQAGAQTQAQARGGAQGEAGGLTIGGGATRTPVLSNARVQITRITFPPNSDMLMHSVGKEGDNHYDLMILLTPAKLEGQIDDKVVASDKPGNFWEIPGAPSQHAFRNRSNQPIDAIIVGLK